MEGSFDQVAEKFLPKDQTFFDRTQKTMYGSISFCLKNVCTVWSLPWTRKRQFQKMPEKRDTECSKSFCTTSEFRFKMKHSCKKKFLVRNFICTCSMQFSQPSRVFLPAVRKFPAQNPKLFVETVFPKLYHSPNSCCENLQGSFDKTVDFSCSKSKKNNGKWFSSI